MKSNAECTPLSDSIHCNVGNQFYRGANKLQGKQSYAKGFAWNALATVTHNNMPHEKIKTLGAALELDWCRRAGGSAPYGAAPLR
jgi:hypothetical protein